MPPPQTTHHVGDDLESTRLHYPAMTLPFPNLQYHFDTVVKGRERSGRPDVEGHPHNNPRFPRYGSVTLEVIQQPRQARTVGLFSKERRYIGTLPVLLFGALDAFYLMHLFET
jgi:hypothetical protein